MKKLLICVSFIAFYNTSAKAISIHNELQTYLPTLVMQYQANGEWHDGGHTIVYDVRPQPINLEAYFSNKGITPSKISFRYFWDNDKSHIDCGETKNITPENTVAKLDKTELVIEGNPYTYTVRCHWQ